MEPKQKKSLIFDFNTVVAADELFIHVHMGTRFVLVLHVWRASGLFIASAGVSIRVVDVFSEQHRHCARTRCVVQVLCEWQQC